MRGNQYMQGKTPPPLPPDGEVSYRLLASFPGYAVTSSGAVLSGKLGVWRERRQCVVDGYFVVRLSVDGVISPQRVHRLILEAFAGSCPPGAQCRHLDGNRQNNALSNLVWGTAAENSTDRVAHGRQACGEQIRFAKLIAVQVIEIRNRLASGETYAVLAKEYGVGTETIARINRGEHWAHIPSPTGAFPVRKFKTGPSKGSKRIGRKSEKSSDEA